MSFGGSNTLQQYSSNYGLGHNGVKISLNYFDGIPEPSLLNALRSNELKLIFKSLLKRDEITKERACVDLLKLISDFQSNEYLFDNDIFSLCWSQVYAKLLMSESRNIRSQSHQITVTLIKLLNKRIAKFLKDLVPLLLMGTCDADTYVSKHCKSYLSDSFNHNPEKLHTLWTAFHGEILRLVKEIIVIENEGTLSDEKYVNKENSKLRYYRVMTSAIFLLNQLIKFNHDSVQEHKSEYRVILKEERLWKLFDLKDMSNLRTFEALLHLFRTLSSIGYMDAHKETFKLAFRFFFKSLTQVSPKNVLSLSSIVPLIISVLSDLDDYKNGKVWSYEKASVPKLRSFLLVICAASSPGCYNALFKLYEKTSTHGLLDYEKDWFPIWHKSIESLNGKLVLGRFGNECLIECWTNYQKFIEKNQIDQNVVNEDALCTLDNRKPLSKLPALKNPLSSVLSAELVTNKLKEIVTSQGQNGKPYFLENLLILLPEIPNNRSSLTDLFQFLFNSLFKESGNNSAEQEWDELEIYRFFVKSKLEFLSDEIAKFIYKLPSLINRNSYNLLSSILVDFSNSPFFERLENREVLLEDFFLASFTANITNEQIAELLDRIGDKAFQLISTASFITEFVQKYISSYKYEDDGNLFGSRLITANNIISFYNSSQENGRLIEFCGHISQLNAEIRNVLFKDTKIIPCCLFTLSKETSQKLFTAALPHAMDYDDIAERIALVLRSHVSRELSSENKSGFLQYALALLRANSSSVVMNALYPPDKSTFFGSSLNPLDYRFSLVNGLQLNMHLLPLCTRRLDNACWTRLEEFIKYCFFIDSLLDELGKPLGDEDLIFLTMVSELAEDFNCISPFPNDFFNNFKNTLFKRGINFDFTEIIDKLIGKAPKGTSDMISMLQNTSSYPSVILYKCRILQKILLNEVNMVSQTCFNNHVQSIESFITSVARGRGEDSHEYLLASVILSSLRKFGNLESLLKMRTILASECIGVTAADAIKKTHKCIILLNSLLEFDEHPVDDLIPIAPQRLSMVLASISKWLDSDLAYEPESIVMWLSVLQLLESLLKFPAIKSHLSSIDAISRRLLMDCLSMCQLEETPFLLELRMYCVNLYLQLNKFDEGLPAFEEKKELDGSLIELSFLHFTAEDNNQISAIFYRTFDRVLSVVPIETLLPYFDRFFENILGPNDKSINLLRLQVHILTKLISEKQQEAVIEYEFSKQLQDNRSTNGDDHEEYLKYRKPYKIPETLLAKLAGNMPKDYLEYEDKCKFIKYLWYWGITLCYFHNISYNLRQLYIDQLKECGLLNGVLDFLADQIDLQDTEFWINVGTQAILHYDITENRYSPYVSDLFMESKQLLGHLMFDLFDNIGSLTSNWWLNIKDKSLQLKIEKFVSHFISPISISHELDDVKSKIESLRDRDDSLTIKINKVTNEVKASYLIDDQKLELSFKLPYNYPLTNVQVIGLCRVGVSEQKWKRWIMSTQRIITGMNGSVADSLEFFTKNVNLQFSGFEECAICYSILHAVDRKLPTKICPTCNNKFHGSCLYKWFRSSGNNTCPLCRGEIPFRR